VEAGPLEGMEQGRMAAHPPAQTPLQLAGAFGRMRSAWHSGLPISPRCSSVRMSRFYFNAINERQCRGGDGEGRGFALARRNVCT